MLSPVPTDSRLDLVVNRWATDAERGDLLARAAESPDQVQSGLSQATEAGYIKWPGGLQYIFRYAHRVPRPDGGADIVLATDRPMWMWWDAQKSGASAKDPFTVLQLRLNKNGVGEGKLSGKINGNNDAKTIVIDNFDGEPTHLSDVRREKGQQPTS